MTRLWSLVIAAMVVQEFTSTAAALLAARNAGLDLWVIHILWFVITAAEIAIGFFVGKAVQRRSSESRIAAWAKNFGKTLEKRIGRYGKNIFLLALGFLAFAWMAGFTASWIEVSFFDVLTFSLLGEAFWYLLEWGTALGILAITPDFQSALIAVIVAGIALTLLLLLLKKRTRIIR